MYDICCIGHITRDKIVTPQTEVYMAGGTAFYFSHAVRNTGAKYLLVTALGESDMPSVTDLRAINIEVMMFPSAHTVFFENKYTGNLDNRTQRVLQVADAFTTEQLQPVQASIYHLGPLLAHDMSVELIRMLATKGKVSLDAQGFLRKVDGQKVVPIDWIEKMEALPHISMLKANEHEMEVLTGQSDPRTGAQMLADWGVEEVIITLGSKGSVLYHNNIFYDIPADVPHTVADATGCGDTYMAGYLSQRIKGATLQNAGEFAAAMASLKMESPGPFKGAARDIERVLQHSEKTMPVV
jgi:sugar/nucleoside kinase (ribokinase family)